MIRGCPKFRTTRFEQSGLGTYYAVLRIASQCIYLADLTIKSCCGTLQYGRKGLSVSGDQTAKARMALERAERGLPARLSSREGRDAERGSRRLKSSCYSLDVKNGEDPGRDM
jgi:hypothetical protein